MSDIAMCSNHSCPSRDYCYRFTAVPSSFQSYASFNVPDKEDKCVYYLWNGHKIKKEVEEIINDDGDF